MPEEITGTEVEKQDTAEFDDAFAERAKSSEEERREDSDFAEDAPGGVGAEGIEGDDAGSFEQSFHDAATNSAASRGDMKDPDLAAELAALKAENQRLAQSEKSQRGRLSVLTKKLVELQAAPKEPPQGQEESEAGKSEGDDWEEFANEFPEMAAIVDKRLAQVDQKVNSVKTEVDRVATTTDTLAEEKILAYKETQFEILGEKHPDFEEIKASPEFRQFIAEAPDDIRAKIKSKHAEDAIEILDTFKDKTGWNTQGPKAEKSEIELINERRAANLRRSAGISSKKVGHTPKADTGSEDDFDAAFAEASAKKEKQRAQLR